VPSGEALDMLQAMNTGHDGSITTVHANSPRDTLARLETLVLMAGFDLPVRAIREQMASAIDSSCSSTRLRDGTRRITHITEVQGMEGDVITLQDIFFRAAGGHRRPERHRSHRRQDCPGDDHPSRPHYPDGRARHRYQWLDAGLRDGDRAHGRPGLPRDSAR
jgi:hypothetical protein